MIPANFYIVIDISGKQTPIIYTGINQFGYLYNLGLGQMGKSATVANEIEKIKEVLNKQEAKYFLCYSETISLDIEPEETYVYSNMGDVYFAPYYVPTTDILFLLEKWLDFLLAYESGKIPGIINPVTKK